MNYYNELKRCQCDGKETKIIENFFSRYFAYIKAVENHIFKGNEIRNDKFADIDEKQSVLKSLDSIRTTKHNHYLETVNTFSNLYTKKTGIFLPRDFLKNRSTMADLGAIMCYNIKGAAPAPKAPDGALRDQLASEIHKNETLIDELKQKVESDFHFKMKENTR